ncbi:uncharacterized protein LOC124273823 isoform X1 [Haliotis rubra]|uniref:uncharacterized protein LOC124273823 isoform X1 n=1 Tax=Haliotis rubra TaxID=36100 RepID=UPI001EE52661|nr:uncharacterized protein LOC124273823 isoform X1 [Haliotis rubra]
MSKVSTGPVTYKSIGMNGQSDMERTLREKTVIIPEGEYATIREEFVQNVIRYRAKGSKLREDVPFIVIYLSSSRIKDEEGLIFDKLRGLPSAILIIASVGKDSEVSIDLPSDLESTDKDNLRLFIKNGHILNDDMDNECMFQRLLPYCCQLERGGIDYIKEHPIQIGIGGVVVCLIIVIVALTIHFADRDNE